jgi:hypothetical protein
MDDINETDASADDMVLLISSKNYRSYCEAC